MDSGRNYGDRSTVERLAADSLEACKATWCNFAEWFEGHFQESEAKVQAQAMFLLRHLACND